MEQIQVVNINGKYDCKINISVKEWLKLLTDSNITPPNTWKALLGFYHSPNCTANCKELNNDNPNAYKNPITSFGKQVQNKLKRFQVLTRNGDEGDYFIIPMTGFRNQIGFAWTIRPELVKAIKIILNLQDNLILEAIEQYKQKLENDPIYWNGNPKDKKLFGEKYKWEALAHFQKNWKNVEAAEFAKMFEEATKETKNLLDVDHWNAPRKRIIISANYKPQKVKEMFHYLYENNEDFDLRNKDSVSRVRKSIEAFIQDDIKLVSEIVSKENPDQKDYKHLFQNTNAISTYLWLKYPDKYYKYAYEIFIKNKNKLCLYQYDINRRKDCSIDSMFEGFAMYDKFQAKLLKDKELVDMINTRVDNLHLEIDIKDKFHTATIDFGYFVSEFFQPGAQPNLEDIVMSDNTYQYIVDLLKIKKNVILQGAPGTGKTYSTAAIALGILGVEDVKFSDHDAVMDKYYDLVKNKKIFFTTFHQSMDYEDFVEGLKPKIHKDNAGNPLGVTYEVEDGIFKKACKKAVGEFDETGAFDQGANSKTPSPKIDITDENIKIYKVSLGNRRIKSEYYKADSFKNGYIKCYASENYEPYKLFKEMKNGDIVIILSTKISFDAIGVVTSEPYKTDDPSDAAKERRNIKWIFKGKEYPYSRILKPMYRGKEFSAWSVHNVNKEFLDLTKLQKLIDFYQNEEDKNREAVDDDARSSSVVLIIDEINRGNVSRIFGELVTLLEADKRIGCDHPITVTLPYSKKRFSVPSNVYIIGTMNTTDRSTGTLDYAIRRRFAFVTLPADPGVVPEGIARDIFNDIKNFIEDKDHHPEDMDVNDLMVGHSYFMPDESVPLSTEEQLKLKIKYEVAPLLREYCTDGLLTCSQKELDKRIESWEKLEITYKKDSNAASAAAASESETSQTNE